MPRLLSILFLFFACNVSYCINGVNVKGAKSSSIGNASVTLSDVWAIYNNQAGLTGIKNPTIAFCYENKFFLKELGLKSGIFAIPINKDVIGASISQYGYNMYNENKFGLAYAKAFSEAFSAGIQLNYNTVHIAENYGGTNFLTVELGFQAKLSDKLKTGIHIFNPNSVKIKGEGYKETVPAIFRLGLSYKVSKKILLCVETEKDIDYTPILRLGIEDEIKEGIFIRGGLSTNPLTHYFGFGVYLKSFCMDLSVNRHYLLGYSTSIGISYKIKTK